jgi:hypothetical protein
MCSERFHRIQKHVPTNVGVGGLEDYNIESMLFTLLIGCVAGGMVSRDICVEGG